MLSLKENSENRKAMTEAQALMAELKELGAKESALKAEIGLRFKRIKDAGVRKLLHDTPLTALENIDSSLKLSAFYDAGIDNAGVLSEKNQAELTRIKGVGDDTAKKAMIAAMKLKDLISSEYRFFIDASDPDGDEKGLIAAVDVYREADSIFRSAEEALRLLERRYSPAADEAKASQTMLGYLTADKDRRARAADAAAELKKLVTGPEAAEWRKYKDRYLAIFKDASVNAVRRFSANTSDFYATLEHLLDTGGKKKNRFGEERLKYALPEELVRATEEFEPDLSLMKSRLRPYQEFGTKYILSRGRVLLGDDMGLGKTIQAISAIAHVKACGGRYFLVICPLSVLTNWIREIGKHSKIQAGEIYGNDAGAEFDKWIAEGGVAVTTYETVKKHKLPDNMLIDMLVVDEAHYIKNRSAQRTKSVLAYADMSEYVILMSGTPLENRVEEMTGLVEVLNPGVAAELKKPGTVSRPEIYRKTLAPVYLRRQREDVLKELPPLVEKEEWCRMTEKEKECYRDALRHSSASFMPLRYAVWKAEDCSKAEKLLEIWSDARENGRKMLVFSYFLDVLETVRGLLESRGAEVLRIDGSVPAAQRQLMIDEYEAAAAGAVILSQVISGGVGLNIQSASVVVFCEPQIKPSIEEQAIARAYRMGQARSVLVYRLLSQDAIDERMMELLKTKKEDFEKYAAESEVGETQEATRTDSDTQIMKKLAEEERKRYGITAEDETGGDPEAVAI